MAEIRSGAARARDAATQSFQALRVNPEAKTPSASSVGIMRVDRIATRPPGGEWLEPTASLSSTTIGVRMTQ